MNKIENVVFQSYNYVNNMSGVNKMNTNSPLLSLLNIQLYIFHVKHTDKILFQNTDVKIDI